MRRLGRRMDWTGFMFDDVKKKDFSPAFIILEVGVGEL